jgi:hypothetical protein
MCCSLGWEWDSFVFCVGNSSYLHKDKVMVSYQFVWYVLLHCCGIMICIMIQQIRCRVELVFNTRVEFVQYQSRRIYEYYFVVL